jgi:hypothetical protein
MRKASGGGESKEGILCGPCKPFVENTLWAEKRVVFSLVHVVGSNNDLAPWFADDPTDALIDEYFSSVRDLERNANANLANHGFATNGYNAFAAPYGFANQSTLPNAYFANQTAYPNHAWLNQSALPTG